jgi:DNA-binding MarR family transcriptional regulator
MHVVMFSMRRAFHLSDQVGLRLAERFELTPARFDLMSALRLTCRRNGRKWARQISLRDLVGTSAANISRLLTKLEKSGLVRRLRDAKGRSCGVRLTAKGRERLAWATRRLVREGVAHRVVQGFFPPRRGESPRTAKARNFRTLVRLSAALGTMRRTLGDRARLQYLIHVPRRRPDIGCVAA